MLTIKNLFLYLKRDLRPLLEDFNFSLQPNQKVALIGEEGNGKSSLLEVIYNREKTTSYLEVAGVISKEKELIAYLPQTIPENILAFGTKDYLEKEVQSKYFDYNLYYKLLSELDFPEERISNNLKIKSLSGGEKIKFLLLVEMQKDPTLLLLDEPSNDLDLESIKWLEKFILNQTIPVMFVSHDELLLENCANTIIHLEQLKRKSVAQHTIANLSYGDYIENREAKLLKQTQLAKKEQAEYEAKMIRYRQIYQRVQHELRTIPRAGSDSAGKNLKDKMRSVKSMGKRFTREKEQMTQRPDFEASIDLRFNQGVKVPEGKKVLDLNLPLLQAGKLELSKNINLMIRGPEKICIIGANGSGKTTLLRKIIEELDHSNHRYGYMPQDYTDEMDPQETALKFITESTKKEELTKASTYLGSLNFTRTEMFQPLADLSGGQRAKLYFAKLIFSKAEVLVLDEPTRNLSPLSGPEIRQALVDFQGCIIAVSHDRKLIETVFSRTLLLTPTGLKEI